MGEIELKPGMWVGKKDGDHGITAFGRIAYEIAPGENPLPADRFWHIEPVSSGEYDIWRQAEILVALSRRDSAIVLRHPDARVRELGMRAAREITK